MTSMIEIPDNLKSLLCPPPRTQPDMVSPAVLLFYGPNKHGKTRAISALPDCRIVDLDYAGGGTKYIANLPFEPYRPQTLAELTTFCAECAKYKPYKFVAFDTLDTLEEWAIEKSTEFWRKSPIGKRHIKDGTWDGESILTVPGRDGGGGPSWAHLRTEMQKILVMTMTVAPHVIWVGHLKATFGEDKETRETSSGEVDLIGRAKQIATSMADAFGLVIRDAANPKRLMMTFRYKQGAVRGGGGGRCEHIEGKEICLAEKQEDGSIKTNWHLVYPELSVQATTTGATT